LRKVGSTPMPNDATWNIGEMMRVRSVEETS
jgi:hypothetical protein